MGKGKRGETPGRTGRKGREPPWSLPERCFNWSRRPTRTQLMATRFKPESTKSFHRGIAALASPTASLFRHSLPHGSVHLPALSLNARRSAFLHSLNKHCTSLILPQLGNHKGTQLNCFVSFFLPLLCALLFSSIRVAGGFTSKCHWC